MRPAGISGRKNREYLKTKINELATRTRTS
jgi:hypothetical protein